MKMKQTLTSIALVSAGLLGGVFMEHERGKWENSWGECIKLKDLTYESKVPIKVYIFEFERPVDESCTHFRSQDREKFFYGNGSEILIPEY